MKLSDIEFFLVQPSGEHQPAGRSVLVCLSLDNGLQGWGEARLPWRAAELAARREALLPALAGRVVFQIEELLQLDALDHPLLACAVEAASWDLIGRSCGQPVCHLLGGSYRQHVPVAARLPEDEELDPAQFARELAEHGFHSQTLTATGEVTRDVRRVIEVMEATDQRSAICLDGAGRYSLATARQMCGELPEGCLDLLVDPLATDDLAAYAALARQVSVPLGIAAAVDGPRRVMAAARAGAAERILIDPQRVGGLSVARRCAAVASAAGMSVALCGSGGVGIAMAAALQLAAATPELSGGNYLDAEPLHNDLLVDPLEIVGGMISVPQGPGLGVEIDRARLEECLVG